MAFTPETLSVLVQPIGGMGLRLHGYETDDDVPTITGVGYFLRGTQYGLRFGDLLFVSPVDGAVATYIATIDAIDANGNASAVVAAVDLTSDDIGSTIQAYSANLDSWSVVAPSEYLTTAAAAAAAAGYQPIDADLTAIGALAKTDGNIIVGDGSTWVAESGATARASLGLTLADAAAYRANTSSRTITTDAAWGAMAEVTLTDAATIAWDMSLGIDFTVTLTASRTLGNPTNTTVGKRGRIRVVQNGTGGWTLTKSSNHKTAGGAALSIPLTASAEGYIYYDCVSSTKILLSGSNKAWS